MKNMRRPLPLHAITSGLLLVWMSACTPQEDLDGDGFSTAQGDCDDSLATTYPGATELCDTFDNDCNGIPDDSGYYYQDLDGDGYGNADVEKPDCKKPSGFVESAGDCDDSNPNVKPGAKEVCDGADNNCDNQTDENLPTLTYYLDEDGDGYGIRETTQTTCTQPAGYAEEEGDCDDRDPAVNPGERESCDALDNNCSGLIDEGYPIGQVYPDLDGDFYGDYSAEGITACTTAAGYSILNADCDDDNELVNPMAVERCDGLDNNCNQIVDENLRQVFYEDADGDGFGNIPVETCNPGDNEVVGRGDCDDTNPSIHPGATDPLGDGKDSDCGGTDNPEPHVMLSATSSPLIKPTLLAAKDGATIWVGPAVLIDGDLSCYGKKIKLRSTHGAEATVIDGAAFSRIFIFTQGEDASCEVDGFTIANGYNEQGAGVYISNASPTLSNNRIFLNQGNVGAGVYLNESNAKLVNNVISDNVASDSGGGVFMLGGAPRLTNNLIINNAALGSEGPGYGGGVTVSASDPYLLNNTIASNDGPFGGGVALIGQGVNATFQNNIIAFNGVDNVWMAPEAEGSPAFAYNVLFNRGFENHNLSGLPSTNKLQDPKFVVFARNESSFISDFHLSATSGLADAGNPATFDPDDSRAEIGAYGGQDAQRAYYKDTDNDGAYDGWEYRFGFLPKAADASQDADGDGLSNAQEQNAGTDPYNPDCDNDGSSDKEEVSAGAHPLDWYSRPSAPEGITVEVPGDFETLQEALDQITYSGHIVLKGGLYTTPIVFFQRHAIVEGESSDNPPRFSTAEGTTFFVNLASLDLSNVVIQDSSGIQGGAIHMQGSRGTLENLSIVNNQATEAGGGLYLQASAPVLINVELAGNEAERGGAIYTFYGRATVESSLLEENLAVYGGALYSRVSWNHLEDSRILDNTADQGAGSFGYQNDESTFLRVEIAHNKTNGESELGAGLMISNSAQTFTSSQIHGHRTARGAGVYMLNDFGSLFENCLFYNNIATDRGGAFYLQYSDPVLLNSAVYDNLATNTGAGMYLDGSGPLLHYSVLVNNVAGVHGGGIHQEAPIWEGATLPNVVSSGSVLAFNTPDNLFAYVYEGKADDVELTYSLLYVEGGSGTNVSPLGTGCLSSDPKFVNVDSTAGAYDFHPASGSPLIDAGNPTEQDADGTRADIGLYGGPLGNGF